MKLTFRGKTQTPAEWALETGLTAATIISRKSRGWSDEKALTEPVFSNDTKITKNDAELYLNELERHQLPDELRILMDGQRTKKLGQFLRASHTKAFDKWYNEKYKPEKQNEINNRDVS